MRNMNARHTHNPKDISHYSAEELRKELLVEKVFIPSEVSLAHTHSDRMIFDGVTPTTESLEIILNEELGVDYFLEQRGLGVINIGGPGFIEIDGRKEAMKKQNGYYVGKETQQVIFSSEDATDPAKFYISSIPTHHKYPSAKISTDGIKPMETRGALTLNEHKVYQYIHPNIYEGCQLQMGYTVLKPGSFWDTMSCHTHERRMEAYVYFDMGEDIKIFHMMDDPAEIKYLVTENEQAVVSPSWSIHSGVGTSSYSFIWAICREDITYTDMDMVPMNELE